jgi:hypothetical protein
VGVFWSGLSVPMGKVGFMTVSAMHEVLADLFRSQPSLAVELLSGPFRLAVPAHAVVELSSGELTEVAPAEFRADAVVLLRSARGEPVLGVVVEVQLSPTKDKWWTWPAYLISLRTRFKCEVALLVVCPDAAVAAWCATPIRLGPPNWTLTPLVLGPDRVPVVTDPDLARQQPHLTMLSAIAHGAHPERDQILGALLAALDTFDQDTAARYTDHVLTVLTEAARDHLEALMTAGTYEYKSDFARRYYHQGQTEGRAEGLTEGRTEGRAEGRTEGLTEGEVRALLAILNARGIPVSDDVHARIAACTDLDHLDTWVRRASTATTIQDLFRD